MILWAYCIERQMSPDNRFSDQLRAGMVQMIAMVRLLTQGWYEPVTTNMLHGSTLVQQILSVLAQYGGLNIQQMWNLLCASGPFSTVSKKQFTALMRKLGEEEIIFQDATGLLLLAPRGEHITEDYRFYAAFSSDEEFRILAGNRTLGSMPVSRPLTEGSFLIFAGRRWQVISVSQTEKVIDVQPASAGAVPGFDGGHGAVVHDRVRKEMREVLRSNVPVAFLDETGQMLLQEGRGTYARLGLESNWLLQDGNETRIILWRGDRVNDTLLLLLQSLGYKGLSDGVSVLILDSTVENVRTSLASLSAQKSVDPVVLASSVQNKVREKWDGLLPSDLLDVNFASSYIDIDGALGALRTHFTGQV
jgi:ATP-dependent Lhr-like helicase